MPKFNAPPGALINIARGAVDPPQSSKVKPTFSVTCQCAMIPCSR